MYLFGEHDTRRRCIAKIVCILLYTAITDKVLHSKTLPKNLDEAMSQAIKLKAGFQLSEGVNMAWKINIMQAEINETEVMKDTRARSNICWGCGEKGNLWIVGIPTNDSTDVTVTRNA